SQAKGDAEVAHVVAERFDDLGVHEFEHAMAKIDQGNLDSQGCGHAGILDTNNAGADNGHCFWNRRQLGKHITVDNGGPVNRNLIGVSRRGPCRDDDELGLAFLRFIESLHSYVVGVQKGGRAVENLDSIAPELGVKDVYFMFDDMIDTKGEIFHGDFLLDCIADAVESTLSKA